MFHQTVEKRKRANDEVGRRSRRSKESHASHQSPVSTGTGRQTGIGGQEGPRGPERTRGTGGTGGTVVTRGTIGTGGTGPGGTIRIEGTAGTGGTGQNVGSRGTIGAGVTEGTLGTGQIVGTGGTIVTGGTIGVRGPDGPRGPDGAGGTRVTGTEGTTETAGTGNQSGQGVQGGQDQSGGQQVLIDAPEVTTQVQATTLTREGDSLMQQMSQAQRQYGTIRMPPSLSQMQGRDFLRDCIVQKVNIKVNDCFGDRITRREKCVGKKFHSLCYEICTIKERNYFNYNDPRRPGTNDPGYAVWERGVRNFTSALMQRLIENYLPKFNETVKKKRTINKQGKTVGAITDMIYKATKTDSGARKRQRS